MKALTSLLLASILIAPRALAQDQDTLAPIIVTATRFPATAATLASSVQVLEGDDLARAGITTLGDALRTLGGAALARNGSFGGITSLFLRGGQSDYVRVLVDGVALNAAGGAVDLANLSLLNVDRIELVRGPGSVLYGSDAISGVVQIFTRESRGPRGSLAVAGGRYGSSDVSAAVSAGGPRLGLTLAAGEEASDGLYDFNNHYRNGTLATRLHLAPNAGTDISVTARLGDALYHYPTDGAGNQVDSNAYATSRATTISLDATRYLTSTVQGRLLLGYHREADRTEDAQDSPADTTGLYDYHSRSVDQRTSADASVRSRLGRADLTVGAALEEERTNSSYTSNFGPGGGPDATRTNGAAYAQLVSRLPGRASLQAGVRADDNQRFGTFGTWRLGLSAFIADMTRLRLNVGTAFREPSFGENYSTAFTVGNPNLRPERSASIELGLDQRFAAGSWGVAVTAFAQRFRDMIQYTFSPPPGDSANYFNIAGVNVSGVEVAVDAPPIWWIKLSAQYTGLHTAVTDSGYDGAQFKPGSPLIRRPAGSGAVSAELLPVAGIAGGARLALVGPREDLDFSQFPSPRVVLPAYRRVDLWADVALTRSARGRATTTLTVRLDNATDTRYQEIYGFRTPGRTLRVGARIEAGR